MTFKGVKSGASGVNDTDEALVWRSQRGDRAAFEELVRRTARLVFARIYLDTGDSHRAEDLAQETYLIAWRRVSQLKDPTGLRPWLLSIANSVRIDSIRREGRKKRAGGRQGDEAMEQVVDGGASPALAMEQEEAREKALNVLKSLPEEYRLPLTLRYIAGADYETIGRELGLSNGSLRGLLNRGMAKLREMLNVDSRDLEEKR